MTCDEFEAVGLDAERDASLADAQRAAAAAHAASCARCAALRDSWEATRMELRSLARTTALDTPARVEMRLRQQFRTQYHAPKVRRTAIAAAWALAAAAVLVGAVSWVSWRCSQHRVANNIPASSGAAAANQQSPGKQPRNLGECCSQPGADWSAS